MTLTSDKQSEFITKAVKDIVLVYNLVGDNIPLNISAFDSHCCVWYVCQVYLCFNKGEVVTEDIKVTLLQSHPQDKDWNPLTSRPVLFSRQVMPDSLWPRGLQHAALFCPLLSPGVCSNSCLLWHHPTSHPSVAPFSSYPQSSPFPWGKRSGSFPVSQLFTSGGQKTTGASASVLPMNI